MVDCFTQLLRPRYTFRPFQEEMYLMNQRDLNLPLAAIASVTAAEIADVQSLQDTRQISIDRDYLHIRPEPFQIPSQYF